MFSKKVINIKLSESWNDCSMQNPDGPLTFIRGISKNPGALQVSFAIRKGGQIPNPSYEDLINMAIEVGKGMDFGEIVESFSRDCTFGILGSAVFTSRELARSQIWYLSNGEDFILATHICPEMPESNEVEEAKDIVNNLYISKKGFWKQLLKAKRS